MRDPVGANMIGAAHSHAGNGAVLPVPAKARWQPLRSGLLNLYRYDEQLFEYEQGHLLLRGNNGTGKSRVLALQLPFLLDGEVGSHRLEPDGDPAKRIEWNLLMGRYDDRLGYTWIEFGRRDEDGQEYYLTLGCGLRAVEGRGLVSRWFFMSPKRVGRDLALRSPDGHVFTKDRLVEELGTTGEIFTTVAAYRRAVDQALFKLGEVRYEALLNLLIQLRQPQLLRDLNEQKLSDVLSEALPPISADIIDVAAESFRGLEDDRRQLDDLVEAGRGVDQFLKDYRDYARLAACRRGEAVRTAHAGYEAALRQLRKNEEEHQAAEARLAEIEASVRQLAIDQRGAEATVEALRSDPRMRSAESLDAARQQAAERKAEAATAKQDLDAASVRRVEQEQQREAATAHEAAQSKRVQEAYERARIAAVSAGLDTEHAGAIELLGLPDVRDPSSVQVAEDLLTEAAGQRRAAARHIQRLNGQVADAETSLREAKQRQTDLSEQLDAAQEAHRQARRGLESAVESLRKGYRDWCRGLVELKPAPLDELADALWEWSQTGDGKSPLAAAVEEAQAATLRQIEERRGEALQRQRTLESQEAECTAEITRLEAGDLIPPPVTSTRDEQARSTRPGAPLWMLCDFSDAATPGERAGVEAALEASGLLDAWLTPGGELLKAGERDAVLVAGRSPEAPADGHLGMVLRPSTQADLTGTRVVGESTIAAVLRHIGLGEGSAPIWVSAEGRWQAGPLHGYWSKTSPQYIGKESREAYRRERLAVLVVQLEEIRGAMQQVHAEIVALTDRTEAVAREASTVPDDAAARQSLAVVATTAAGIEQGRERLADAEKHVLSRRGQLNAIKSRRDHDAQDLGITQWIDNLQGLEDALTQYQLALNTLWPEIRRLVDAHGQAMGASKRAQDATAEQTHREYLFHESEKKVEAAIAHLRTMEASIGLEGQEIQARLQEAREQVERLRQDSADAQEARVEASGDVRTIAERIAGCKQTLEQHVQQREAAVESLRQYLQTGLLAIAEPDLASSYPTIASVTAAVDLARRTAAAIPNVRTDEDAWERSQNVIHASFQQLSDVLLAHDYHPTACTEHGVFLVTVPFQGRTCRMEELRAALAEEIATRDRVLNAKEREILENHLIGEVAIHLHDRLHAAEKLVQQMNDELRQRPTSTGMALRFRWEPVDEGPPGLPEARARLMRVSGTWSPAEREALGIFLQERIRAVRAENDAGTWQEHLTAALDYRRWHHFSVERCQDGQWRRLTRRTHGTGSGGEKAIALIIPQFAAAAAHYRSAHEWAPRPILLDEAFVGVDADMRSKCMGLLDVFDLDFVMTSEREWGCYPTLPGVAIYHLSSRPGIDAVGVTRWVWNGQTRLRADVPRVRQAAEAEGLLSSHGVSSSPLNESPEGGDGDATGHTGGNGNGELA